MAENQWSTEAQNWYSYGAFIISEKILIDRVPEPKYEFF
jgi:hypothetical protein